MLVFKTIQTILGSSIKYTVEQNPVNRVRQTLRLSYIQIQILLSLILKYCLAVKLIYINNISILQWSRLHIIAMLL